MNKKVIIPIIILIIAIIAGLILWKVSSNPLVESESEIESEIEIESETEVVSEIETETASKLGFRGVLDVGHTYFNPNHLIEQPDGTYKTDDILAKYLQGYFKIARNAEKYEIDWWINEPWIFFDFGEATFVDYVMGNGLEGPEYIEPLLKSSEDMVEEYGIHVLYVKAHSSSEPSTSSNVASSNDNSSNSQQNQEDAAILNNTTTYGETSEAEKAEKAVIIGNFINAMGNSGTDIPTIVEVGGKGSEVSFYAVDELDLSHTGETFSYNWYQITEDGVYPLFDRPHDNYMDEYIYDPLKDRDGNGEEYNVLNPPSPYPIAIPYYGSSEINFDKDLNSDIVIAFVLYFNDDHSINYVRLYDREFELIVYTDPYDIEVLGEKALAVHENLKYEKYNVPLAMFGL